MSVLFCVHNWSQWIEIPEPPMGEKIYKMRICSGLCRRTWNDPEPEPRVVIGEIE